MIRKMDFRPVWSKKGMVVGTEQSFTKLYQTTSNLKSSTYSKPFYDFSIQTTTNHSSMFHAKDLAFFSAFHFSMRWTQAKLQALGELLECLFTFWYNYTYYFRTRENKFLVIYWLNGCKLIDPQSPNKNVKKMFGRCMDCLYWRKLGCSKLFAPLKSLELNP